jgi:hypothetical protein
MQTTIHVNMSICLHIECTEIVAVDPRGHTYRFDKRTTGAERADIEKRLAGVDGGFLPNVTAAQAAVREAQEIARAQARIDAPTGRTAGEIRAAWARSRDTADPARDLEKLHEALAERGMSMARVSAEEAYRSERLGAFAKETGNRAPVFTEGELVIVNRFRSVYRFDERTTGQFRGGDRQAPCRHRPRRPVEHRRRGGGTQRGRPRGMGRTATHRPLLRSDAPQARRTQRAAETGSEKMLVRCELGHTRYRGRGGYWSG